MNTLLSPQEAYNLAFTPDENLSPNNISTSDIKATELLFIKPYIGAALYEKLLSGHYPELRQALLPPIAFYLRQAIQPRLDVHTDRLGTSTPHSDATHRTSVEACRLQKLAFRRVARLLRRDVLDFLEQHTDAYPEFQPMENPLKHCSIHGNIVQTF